LDQGADGFGHKIVYRKPSGNALSDFCRRDIDPPLQTQVVSGGDGPVFLERTPKTDKFHQFPEPLDAVPGVQFGEIILPE
jgi:hypothetical protein